MKITAFDSIDSFSPTPAKASRAIRQMAARVAGAFKTWSEARRDRREIAQMGAHGRRELHSLLLARGEGGLSLALWPAWQREADARACDSEAFDSCAYVSSLKSAHSAAILRSVSR